MPFALVRNIGRKKTLVWNWKVQKNFGITHALLQSGKFNFRSHSSALFSLSSEEYFFVLHHRPMVVDYCISYGVKLQKKYGRVTSTEKTTSSPSSESLPFSHAFFIHVFHVKVRLMEVGIVHHDNHSLVVYLFLLQHLFIPFPISSFLSFFYLVRYPFFATLKPHPFVNTPMVFLLFSSTTHPHFFGIKGKLSLFLFVSGKFRNRL